MLPIQAIELGIYCAQLLGEDEDIEKYINEWYGSYAEAKLKNPILPPEGKQDAGIILGKRLERLIHALRFYDSPNKTTLEKIISRVWKKHREQKADERDDSYPFDGFNKFVLEVTLRAGCLLADLIATADGLFSATAALATGGPISGAMGKLVREFARNELEEGYGYNVVDLFKDPHDRYRALRLHGIYFPEPQGETSTSAAWGAGKTALELYKKKFIERELLRLEEWLRSRQPGQRLRLTGHMRSEVLPVSSVKVIMSTLKQPIFTSI